LPGVVGLPLEVRATRDAYDAAARTYTEYFKDALARKPFDRAMLHAFAGLVASVGGGRVADLGCGPGMVTSHLRALGMSVLGIDISFSMVSLARKAHPAIPFIGGSMEALPLADATLAGVVACYSIIHALPARLPGLFSEFIRTLRPGGFAMLAFQGTDGPTNNVEAFDHAVTPAYRYSVDHISGLLTRSGATEIARLIRQPDEEERFMQVCVIVTKRRST
jgi:SAM-dependent methyltransferase